MSFKTEMLNDGSWPPTSNGMPDLGAYPDTLLAQFIVASNWEGRGWLTPDAHALAANLARLADKAVYEYRAASACLSAFVEARLGWQPNFLAPHESMTIEGHAQLLRAAGHIENCMNALWRAEGFFNTRAFEAVTTPDQQAMIRDLHRGVSQLRARVEHADKFLNSGNIRAGEPVFIAVTNDGVYFAGKYVLYGELATLVISLWLIARAGFEGTLRDMGIESLAGRGEP